MKKKQTYPSTITGINGTRLDPDGNYVVELATSNGNAVRLTMDSRMGMQLKDSISALSDDWEAEHAPSFGNATAQAYRIVRTVEPHLDLHKKTLLLAFNSGTPHRLGIAVDIQAAHVLRDAISMIMEQAAHG